MDCNKNLIVLVNLPLSEDSYKEKGNVYPSTAILLIGAYLKKHGFEIIIIDGAYDEYYKTSLIALLETRSNEIIYVGISVMVTQMSYAVDVITLSKKKFPELKIVIGGAHPSLYPKESIKYLGADFVVINEGTNTAVDLARALVMGDDPHKVKGVCSVRENEISYLPSDKMDDFGELPFFDFSLITVENFLNVRSSVYSREFPYVSEKLRIMPILTGLGCPFRCEFCINVILKRKYRFRSAKEIIGEIKTLQREYGANTFLFLDEDFFVNKKRVLELFDLAETESLKFNFRAWCRADHFKEEYLNVDIFKRFEKIGHISLAIGAESANNGMLRAMRKDITRDDILRSAQILSRTKVFARYSFMMGLENETMENIKETIKFCYKLKKVFPKIDIAGPVIFRLYPGSPMFNRINQKYKLMNDTSINEWGKQFSRDGTLSSSPWVPREFEKNKKYLAFYTSIFFQNDEKFTNDVGSKKFEVIKRFIFKKTTDTRIRFFFFKFPFEYWIASALKGKRKLMSKFRSFNYQESK